MGKVVSRHLQSMTAYLSCEKLVSPVCTAVQTKHSQIGPSAIPRVVVNAQRPRRGFCIPAPCAQVEYSEEPGSMFYFRYPIAGGGPGDYLPVATTRPETILGDTAVAVHPEDPRFAAFIGGECAVPFTERCGRLFLTSSSLLLLTPLLSHQ